VAGLDGGHEVADVEHLGDALVPERERRRERAGAGDDQRVEVAGGHGDVAHDRLAVAGQGGLGRVAPLEPARSGVGQGAHAARRYRPVSPLSRARRVPRTVTARSRLRYICARPGRWGSRMTSRRLPMLVALAAAALAAVPAAAPAQAPPAPSLAGRAI